jgi:hypothetical protein
VQPAQAPALALVAAAYARRSRLLEAAAYARRFRKPAHTRTRPPPPHFRHHPPPPGRRQAAVVRVCA